MTELKKMNVHGNVLYNKKDGDSSLDDVWEEYRKFLTAIADLKVLDEATVNSLVSEFNKYRSEVLYKIEA